MAPHACSHWLTERLGSGRLDGRAKQSRAALVAMSLVAAAGAILSWPWCLQYALMAPLATWLIISSRLVVYRQLSPGSPDRRVPVVLVIPVLFAAAIRPTRFSGLPIVAAFAVLYISSRRRSNAAASGREAV